MSADAPSPSPYRPPKSLRPRAPTSLSRRVNGLSPVEALVVLSILGYLLYLLLPVISYVLYSS